MKKRTYRAVSLKHVEAAQLVQGLPSERLVVGIDIAKEGQFAALMDARQQVHRTVKWKHPEQTRQFVQVVEGLAAAGGAIEVVMEPSGTYGDAIRYALLQAGFDVARVNPKRSKDAAEVYDGVPSLHDAKSAAIVAKLHLDGASEEWPVGTEAERTLKAAVRLYQIHKGQFRDNRNRLEGLMARHWPELPRIMDLDSATLLELLIAFGDPRAVASRPDHARQLMQRVGGHFLAEHKVDAVIESASCSVGVPMVAQEVELVCEVAAEARRCQRAAHRAKRKLEQLTANDPTTARMAPVVGRATAAILVASAGKPERYSSAGAYLKSLGLNLKEKSSGKKQSRLRITKRGPGVARLVLYLAALRLIQRDVVVRAWYAKKVRRNGGCKVKAVVAVLRKIVKGLWHTAVHSEDFDSTKLFDTSRLSFAPASLLLP